VLSCAAVGAALGDWLSYWLGYHYHEQIGACGRSTAIPTAAQGSRILREMGRVGDRDRPLLGPLRASVPIVAGVTQMPQIEVPDRQLELGIPVGVRSCSRPGTFGMKWWLHHFHEHRAAPLSSPSRRALDDDAIRLADTATRSYPPTVDRPPRPLPLRRFLLTFVRNPLRSLPQSVYEDRDPRARHGRNVVAYVTDPR
jgi:hypothetical protein